MQRLQVPSVPSLPAPGPIDRWLLEQPLPLAVGLVLLGLAGLLIARGAGRGRLGVALAVAGVALGAAAVLVGRGVVTEGERLTRATHELIDAAARADTAALEGMLTEDVGLRTAGDIAGAVPTTASRRRVLDRVEAYLGSRYRLGEWSARSLSASVDGANVARTQALVSVRLEEGGFANQSWWRIHWTRRGDGPWRAFELEPLWIQLVGSAGPP